LVKEKLMLGLNIVNEIASVLETYKSRAWATPHGQCKAKADKAEKG